MSQNQDYTNSFQSLFKQLTGNIENVMNENAKNSVDFNNIFGSLFNPNFNSFFLIK